MLEFRIAHSTCVFITDIHSITVDIFKGELAIAILKMNHTGGFDNLIFKNTPFHDRGQL